MPIVYKKEHLSSVIAVWESNEESDFLIQRAVLTADEMALLRNFKSDSRKREFLTVRALLQELFPAEKLLINYSKNGKPNLSGKKNISISHTKNYVAIMVGEFSHGGIDLETINERIFKLATKFLNESEIKFTGFNPSIEKLQIIWGAKEVLYKIHEIGDVDFKKHLNVEEFTEAHSGNLYASILKSGYEKRYHVHYETFAPMMITWASD